MKAGGEINFNNPLRIYFVSDYPLARERGERTSASAHQIRDAAGEMWKEGHDVVVIAPGHVDRPERDHDLPYPVRTILFKPQDYAHQWNTLGPRYGFNFPVLDKNPNLGSDTLLWRISEQKVDQLLSGYMAMFRLTSIIFGEPDVVVTPHAVSLWNYVASNYPVLFMSSESDQFPAEGTEDAKNTRMIDLIREGVQRAFGGVALSNLIKTRLLKGRNGLKVAENSVHRIQRGLNPALFHHMADTTKAELLVRFPQLKGVSLDSKWVVLYDEYENPDVLRNLMKVSSYIENMYPDEDVVCIVVTEGDGHKLCEDMNRLQLDADRMRLITNVGMREKAWLVNAADSSLMYVGQEAPTSVTEPIERDLLILSMTAVVAKEDGRPVWYFPGRVDPFSKKIVKATLEDFDRNAVDLGLEKLKRVRRTIETLHHRDRRETSTYPVVSEERDIQERARRAVRYKARVTAFQRLAGSLVGNIPSDVQPLILEEPKTRDKGREKPFAVRSGIARGLEPLLFKAAMEGKRISAEHMYTDSPHHADRQARLDDMRFNSEAREAWEHLTASIEQKRSVGHAFRAWQHEMLGALYCVKFLDPLNSNAIPDPIRNPNGIISEMSRLVGHRSAELFIFLQLLSNIPAEELIRVGHHSSDGPETPKGGSGSGGGSGSNGPLGGASFEDHCDSNVIRLPTAMRTRQSFAMFRPPAVNLKRG